MNEKKVVQFEINIPFIHVVYKTKIRLGYEVRYNIATIDVYTIVVINNRCKYNRCKYNRCIYNSCTYNRCKYNRCKYDRCTLYIQ